MIPGVLAQQQLSGGGHAASGVHFAGGIQSEGPTWLDCAALSCGTDNGLFSFSFWQRGLLNPSNANCALWVTAATSPGQFSPWVGTDVDPRFKWRNFLGDDTYWLDGLPDFTVWSHLLGSMDTNHGAGGKIKVLYANDVLLTPDQDIDTHGALVSVCDGVEFTFGDDTFSEGPTIDVADVWIAPNVALHDGTNTIPVATRRQFITAGHRPADPAGFPTSAVLFTGGPSTFATNLGTGGSFTLTGSLSASSTNP